MIPVQIELGDEVLLKGECQRLKVTDLSIETVKIHGNFYSWTKLYFGLKHIPAYDWQVVQVYKENKAYEYYR